MTLPSCEPFLNWQCSLALRLYSLSSRRGPSQVEQLAPTTADQILARW